MEVRVERPGHQHARHGAYVAVGWSCSAGQWTGIGAGSLVAGRLSWPRRRAIGLALVGAGVTTTIPIAQWMLRQNRRPRTGPGVEWDARLIGATDHVHRNDGCEKTDDEDDDLGIDTLELLRRGNSQQDLFALVTARR